MEFFNTVPYKEFLVERQEVLRHKWIESEKAGYDIGFERACSIGLRDTDPLGAKEDTVKQNWP
jgi:hypothetical protein